MAAAYFGRILVIGIVVIVFVAVGYRFTNRQFHIFARYELFALVFNLGGPAAFALMLQGISGRNHFMLDPDVATNIWFGNLVHMASWLPTAAVYVGDIFGSLALAVAVLGLPFYFLHTKRLEIPFHHPVVARRGIHRH